MKNPCPPVACPKRFSQSFVYGIAVNDLNNDLAHAHFDHIFHKHFHYHDLTMPLH